MNCIMSTSALPHSQSSANNQLGNTYVKIFYRICCLNKPTWDYVKLNNPTIFVRKLQQLKDPSKAYQTPSYWEFTTDGIFHNATQEEVYNGVVENLVEKLNEGNTTILVSFGQTGTGKSATSTGLEFLSDENYGIGPRVLRKLLELKSMIRADKKMTIQISYLEFANNAVYDLFKEYPNSLDIWHVNQDATKIDVTTLNRALQQMYLGEARKDTKQNNKYFSNINTSVLTFYVRVEDLNFTGVHQIDARMHIIDLAGSDAVGNLSCIFKSKCEVGAANLAKTSMEQFFLCLIERSQEKIKARLRTNPLIYFLKDDLTSKISLRFIGHIRTDKEDLQMTLSMLRFGQIIRGYTPATKNIEQHISKMSPENKVKFLERQIEELKQEKIQDSILLNQDLTTNLTSERIEHLQQTIKYYLSNQISEIDIMRTSDATIVFKIFKDMICQQKLAKEGSTVSSRKFTDSELSLPKKKNSLKSSSTVNAKVLKERRKSKKSKDAILDEIKQSPDKVDAETSVPSFDDIRQRSYSHRISQDRSYGSMSQIPKKKRSKLSAIVGKRSSLGKRRSASSFNIGYNQDVLLVDNIPENMEAWNTFIQDGTYISFLEDYKSNEKNIADTYARYMIEIDKLQTAKSEIEAIGQEMIEAKLIKQFTVSEDDKYTETILEEAELRCEDKIEKIQKFVLEQEETVLRSLAELKTHLNGRKEMRKQLSEHYDNYCREKFSVPLPAAKTLSLIEMPNPSAHSALVDNYYEDDVVERVEGGSVPEKIQMYQLRNILDKERNKVMKMRANYNRRIKKC